MGIRKFWKQLLNIPKAIPKGEEKAYKFQEQQEAAAAEAERWEKKKSEERQQKLQEKYQRLKLDREQQQQQPNKFLLKCRGPQWFYFPKAMATTGALASWRSAGRLSNRF